MCSVGSRVIYCSVSLCQCAAVQSAVVKPWRMTHAVLKYDVVAEAIVEDGFVIIYCPTELRPPFIVERADILREETAQN